MSFKSRWFQSAFRISMIIVAIAMLAGCGTDQKTADAAGVVPLEDVTASMQPSAVWMYFQELTQVPRPSHYEERATMYIADFGRKLGLETIVDAVGNVIIRKSATRGMENRPGVILQTHLDMVAQSKSGFPYNPQTDPIKAFVEKGWVHANGTTLGADDGIGVAIVMALLQAKDIAHGPIEALFTVNEEDGFTGINALAADALKGRIFINIDNEQEGQFLFSSAGGVYVEVQQTYTEVLTPADTSGVKITIDGLLGGHSGTDIDKGRGSAHQLMARLLVNAPPSFGVRVSTLIGGDAKNAIPRTTSVMAALPSNQVAAFSAYVKDFAATVAKELKATDPGVMVTLTPATLPAKVMEASAQQALFGAVYAAPQGVYRMSPDVPGLVETSGNIGILGIGSGLFAASIYVRSAIDTERDAEAERFALVFEQAGATVTRHGAYSSWPPNLTSPIVALMQQTYSTLYKKAPEVVAIHAGLETSVAGVKYPGMDMISIGPTVLDGHSPDERLEAASVSKVYDLIVATLGMIR